MNAYEQTASAVGPRRWTARLTAAMFLLSMVATAATFVFMLVEPTAATPILVMLASTVVLWNAALWTWRLTAAGKPRKRCGLVPLAIANLLAYATVIEASCLGIYAHSLTHGSRTFLRHWAWTWTPLFVAAVACFAVYCVMNSVSRNRLAATVKDTGPTSAQLRSA